MSSNIILVSETGYYRSACVECQRRKQKASPAPSSVARFGACNAILCHAMSRADAIAGDAEVAYITVTACNREWPCDSCRRRKVPDGCRYNEATAVPGDGSHEASTEKTDIFPEKPANRTSLNAAEGQVFEALAERAFVNLGIDSTRRENAPPEQKQDMVPLGSSAQLDRLLELLPPRRLMDDLIQLFINDINFHYYIIYPPVFLQDYHIWWDRRGGNKPISLQYSCLLAMLCSCTIQHVAGNLERTVVMHYGEPIHAVSDKMHTAVRELSGIIPVGHYHMMNIQRLVHSCYWYKAEARFVEAWHVLNQAILEAKELELHIEPEPDAVSEFDREMRRRLWCILDTWDWQISSGLSRPKLIDRGGCTAELPELTLEGYNPSPLEHMKMQSQLTRELASRFGAPKNIISTSEVQEYKGIILAWVRRYPKIYDFYQPDTSRDSVHPWIFPHRFYLYTMACLLILNPIRHYMVKSYSKDSPADELECRSDGLFFSLILIKTQRKWVDKINGRDGRLHFIIFSIFDTAAILCTALVKDHANTIPNKDDILHAIAESTAMLKALINISETAKMSHDILYRLTKKLKKPSMSKESGETGRKRTKVAPVLPSQSASSTARPHAAALQSNYTPTPAGRGPNAPPPQVSAPLPAAGTASAPPQQANLSGYVNAPPLVPPMTIPSSTSAAAHTMPQPMQDINARHLTQQQMPHVSAAPNIQGMHHPHSVQMPIGMGPTGYYQPTQPAVDSPVGSSTHSMSHAGSQTSLGMASLQTSSAMGISQTTPGMVGLQTIPGMQPIGYPPEQPLPLGTGIFNMNIAGGVPAIANLWDVPATPMTPTTSYSIMGHNVPVNVVPEPRELLMVHPQEHVVPDLNLSNLTEEEIGGLAPLWSWHSSNLFSDHTNADPAA